MTPMNQISAATISGDREIGRHGADPGLPAAAHQADRQALLQQEQIGRAEAEHDQRVAVKPVFADRPQRERARYSRTVSVSMSPMPRRSRLPEVA